MDNMNLTINDHEWHRNGSTGEPFYAIAFTLKEDGVSHELVAITSADGDFKTGAVSQWKVINPTDIKSMWRGDRIGFKLKPMFEKLLRDIENEYQRNI